MHYIYRLIVAGEPYIGYTSRDPQIRREEHIKTALSGNWKHNSDLYPLLHEFEGEHEFEILHEFSTEFAALCCEITEIRKAGKNNTLNRSDGGEGSTMTVKTREVDGQMQFMVLPKKVKRAKPKKIRTGRKRRPTSRKRQLRRS